jgi:hypothetical protein
MESTKPAQKKGGTIGKYIDDLTMMHEKDWVIAGTESFLHVPADQIVHIIVRIFQEPVIHCVINATL